MDDRNFEQLARELGTSGSRRHTLRALAGAALAAPLALFDHGPASAQTTFCRRRCFDGQECRNGRCRNGRLQPGERCKRREPRACRSGDCHCRLNRRRDRGPKRLCDCR